MLARVNWVRAVRCSPRRLVCPRRRHWRPSALNCQICVWPFIVGDFRFRSSVSRWGCAQARVAELVSCCSPVGRVILIPVLLLPRPWAGPIIGMRGHIFQEVIGRGLIRLQIGGDCCKVSSSRMHSRTNICRKSYILTIRNNMAVSGKLS
jgi:hypothetical protein